MSSRNVKSCAQYLMLLALVVLAIILLQTEITSVEDILQDTHARLQGPLSSDDPRVLNVLKEHYLSPPSALPYNLRTDQIFKQELTVDSSWVFIHNYVEKLFKNEPPGFFIEAGALDGETVSNSLWLETEWGWTGLLVEPDPESYMQLVTKHRKAWTSHTCLSTEVYPKEEIIVSFSQQKQPEEAVLKFVPNSRGTSHLLGVELDSNEYEAYNKNSGGSFSTVQCFPMLSYLLALNRTTVDFLSLDIQGAEKSVLRSLPWDQMNIRVMVVEIIHQKTFDQEFVDYMKSKQYIFIDSQEVDYLFVKQGDASLKNLKNNQITND